MKVFAWVRTGLRMTHACTLTHAKTTVSQNMDAIVDGAKGSTPAASDAGTDAGFLCLRSSKLFPTPTAVPSTCEVCLPVRVGAHASDVFYQRRTWLKVQTSPVVTAQQQYVNLRAKSNAVNSGCTGSALTKVLVGLCSSCQLHDDIPFGTSLLTGVTAAGCAPCSRVRTFSTGPSTCARRDLVAASATAELERPAAGAAIAASTGRPPAPGHRPDVRWGAAVVADSASGRAGAATPMLASGMDSSCRPDRAAVTCRFSLSVPPCRLSPCVRRSVGGSTAGPDTGACNGGGFADSRITSGARWSAAMLRCRDSRPSVGTGVVKLEMGLEPGAIDD